MAKLFEPFNIGSVELKNRLAMSPMCMYKAKTDGKVTDFHKIHYTTRAIGKVGLIMTEATAVSSEGRISSQDLGLWSDTQMKGQKELTAMVHKYGAKIGVQLAHAGRKSLVPRVTIMAPSAIPFDAKSRTPREMDIDDIENVKNSFVDAAKRAAEAGYDIIEIHGAHGYLINEFLSPLTNKREDEYGGPLDNRARLLYEIVEAVKKEVELPIIVRLSVIEYVNGGLDIKDSVAIAKKLKELGVEMIDVSTGGNQADVNMKPFLKPLYQVHYAQTIRKEAGIPVSALGLITKAEEAEMILKSEKADMVFLGRELLRNPYFAMQAQVELYQKEQDIEESYQRAYL